MNKIYQIKSLLWFVRDSHSVKFHVKSDDYFGTLATIINLLSQEPGLINHPTLKTIKKDLLILQKDYLIISRRERAKEQTKQNNRKPKGRLINQ